MLANDEGTYPSEKDNFYPLMIHNSCIFSKDSSPNPRIRVITPEKLEELKNAVQMFAKAVVRDENYFDKKKISELILQYKLTCQQIYENYAVSFRIIK